MPLDSWMSFTGSANIKLCCDEFNVFPYHGLIKDMMFFSRYQAYSTDWFLRTRVMLPPFAKPI